MLVLNLLVALHVMIVSLVVIGPVKFELNSLGPLGLPLTVNPVGGSAPLMYQLIEGRGNPAAVQLYVAISLITTG